MDKEAFKKEMCALIDKYCGDNTDTEMVSIKKETFSKITNKYLDKYFDPETHIATEEKFIELLDKKIYSKELIGYKVSIYNDTIGKPIIFTIADVNHNNENDPNGGNYDLITNECFHLTNFGESNRYADSNIREWLNSNFLEGFKESNSEFYNHLCSFIYEKDGTVYSDIVMIPSITELGFEGYDEYDGGIPYPIFKDNESRIMNILGKNKKGYYWTRSRRTTNHSSGIWCVYTDGSINSIHYGNSCHLAPLLRIS